MTDREKIIIPKVSPTRHYQ